METPERFKPLNIGSANAVFKEVIRKTEPRRVMQVYFGKEQVSARVVQQLKLLRRRWKYVDDRGNHRFTKTKT